MNRKGFFFVLISFILLSYILLSTTMWVKAIDASEKSYSDAFRASTLNTLTDQVSFERMDNYVDMVAHYAMYRLSNHSIYHPLKAGEEKKEFSHITSAYFELVSDCAALPEHFEDGAALAYSPEESRTYCLKGLLSQLNGSFSTQGFQVESFEVSGMQFNETEHPLLYTYNLTLYLSVKDLQTSTSINRTYRFNKILDAEGMVDPLVARESLDLKGSGPRENMTIFKPIYLYPSENEDTPFANVHEELYPDKIGEGSEGQGWFYGTVVFAEDAPHGADPSRLSQFILAGNYSEIRDVDNWEAYGAYILLNKPESPPGCNDQYETLNPIQRETTPAGRCEESIDGSGSGYTSKPFVVYEDFREDAGRHKYSFHEFGVSRMEEVRVLFISQYSPEEVLGTPRDKLEDVAVFDMEKLRDFARCSYYIVNPEAPSFLQRMLKGGYNYKSGLGIETFLIGMYAGGIYNPALDDRSRVDRDFFADIEGTKIRGMPGCKDAGMCVNPNSDIGHFALSDDAMKFYLGISNSDDEENIGCNDGRASCE
ncbi:MAG TPA: hypothetical protein PKJ97_01000 [Candidatus Bilamarchaeaceae archaeon]|nr:hypothetical protein [Candidatus Bilamarchaeaceae archaeon]